MFYTIALSVLIILFISYKPKKKSKEQKDKLENIKNCSINKKVFNSDSVFYDEYDTSLCRDSLNNIIKINDIISFKEEDIDFEIDHSRPRRAISTYHEISVSPSEFEYWIVYDIVTSIPNVKGYSNLEKSEENTNPYLLLYPIGKSRNGLDSEINDLETFWFIDIKYKTIKQYEDGAIISNIKEIKVIN